MSACDNVEESGPSSSDDSDVDDTDDHVNHLERSAGGSSRNKRSIQWCGVDSDVPDQPPRAIWPPKNPVEHVGGSQSWLNLQPVRVGNPLFGSKMQLYSKTNHYLIILPNGKVRGTTDDTDEHTFLELSSADQPGHIRIRGLATGLFVGMDKKGRLYGEEDLAKESTVFIESFQGYYKTYLSRKYAHLGWYIGIKKSGRFKKGPKTKYGQKAIKFLSIRAKFQ